jgi:large subunit ribosomal protein L25
MKLTYRNRSAERKSDSKRLRCEGAIPSIIYSRGQHSANVAVNGSEFSGLLRSVKPGHLSTQVFELTDEKGGKKKAILKDIQYDPTTYNVIHLDFEELVPGHKVNVKVPIEWIGVADCVGVKAGGVLRSVIRSLRVSCLPEHIPSVFKLDVRNLGMRESRRLKDLDIPNTVRPLTNLNEVVVVIAKR